MDERAEATTMRMDARAKATTMMMVGTGENNEDNQRAEATTTRMVGAGDNDKEDGWEAADEADDGQKNITINLWVNW